MFKAYCKILKTIICVTLIANSVFAQSLPDAIQRELNNYRNSEKWIEGKAYIDSLLKIDKNIPFPLFQRSNNGVIRFEAGDFKGAIKDFDYVIGVVDTIKSHWGWTLADAEHDEPEAYMALGQNRKAGLIYEYFAKRYQSTYSSWKALVLYMKDNKKAKYRKMLPIALANYKLRMERDSLTRNNSWVALDYAELLLIAEKPTEAIAVLNNPKLKDYDNRYVTFKHGLLSIAAYQINPPNYPQIMKDLLKQVDVSGTTKNIGFAFLDPWITHILKAPLQQHYSNMLIAAAKDGGF